MCLLQNLKSALEGKQLAQWTLLFVKWGERTENLATPLTSLCPTRRLTRKRKTETNYFLRHDLAPKVKNLQSFADRLELTSLQQPLPIGSSMLKLCVCLQRGR